MCNTELLLEANNLLIVQQVLASKKASRSYDELQFLNQDFSSKELKQTLQKLESNGFLSTEIVNNEKFYLATLKSKEELEKVGLYDQLGILYDVYSTVEYPERIQTFKSNAPRSEIVSIC